MSSMIGKRIIVFWNEKARAARADWPAFEVLGECDEGYFCKGITAPDGSIHDGSKCFVRFDETFDIMIWKEGL